MTPADRKSLKAGEVCVFYLCNSSKDHVFIKHRLYPYLLIHSQVLIEFLYEVHTLCV